MRKLITLTALCFLVASINISAQNQMSQKEAFQISYNNLKQLVKSKDFKFIGEVVYNNKNRDILKPEENTLTVKSSKLMVDLQPLSTMGKAIHFSDIIENYTVNFDDIKQTISIAFNSNNHEVSLRAMPNGNVFLTIKSNDGNIISQTGKIVKA